MSERNKNEHKWPVHLSYEGSELITSLASHIDKGCPWRVSAFPPKNKLCTTLQLFLLFGTGLPASFSLADIVYYSCLRETTLRSPQWAWSGWR